MTYSYLIKLIVIGDTGVGKSNLLKQFTLNQFMEKYVATIGVEFGAKVVKVRNCNLKLQIWDTAGQEAFISITRGYFRAAIGAVVVFDITNLQSFNNLRRWIDEANEHGSEQMNYVLVGNKHDLSASRAVSVEAAQKFAQDNGMKYFETSAKTGHSVNQCFFYLAERIMGIIESGGVELDTENGVRTGPEYKSGASREKPESTPLTETNKKQSTKRCC